MTPNYDDFKQWAKSKLKEGLSLDYVNKLELRVCTFMDGEPFIGGYPDLNYSSFIYECKNKKNK